MKKVICFVLLAIFLAGCASTQLATKEEMTHEFILNFPGFQKKKLFDKTLKWIANHFRSAKAVIEYNDKESGSIVGNGIIPADTASILWLQTTTFELAFTMNVDVRDEKARIRFVNIEILMNKSNPFNIPNTSDAHRMAQKRFELLVQNLTEFIKQKDDF